jgi:hypothetical protein
VFQHTWICVSSCSSQELTAELFGLVGVSKDTDVFEAGRNWTGDCLRVQWPEPDAEYSPLSDMDVTNEWNFTYILQYVVVL